MCPLRTDEDGGAAEMAEARVAAAIRLPRFQCILFRSTQAEERTDEADLHRTDEHRRARRHRGFRRNFLHACSRDHFFQPQAHLCRLWRGRLELSRHRHCRSLYKSERADRDHQVDVHQR